MSYQHILFATDFSEPAIQVGERAKSITEWLNMDSRQFAWLGD